MNIASVLHGTLRMATPIALAAMGGLFTHRAGVLNIALDGMMLIAAFVGVLLSYATGSIVLAIAGAVAATLCFAVLFNLFGIRLQGNFIITGLAVNLLAGSIAAFVLQMIFGRRGAFADPSIVGLPTLHFHLLENIPIIGSVLNDQTPMVYVSLIILGIVSFVLYQTRFGIYIRAVGENEEAVKAIGINSRRIKYAAVYISAVLSALAGINLALGNLSMFVEGMSNGRGFIALAAIFCGRGTPIGAYLFSFLFGFSEAVQMRLQIFQIPGVFIQMIPFLFIILVLMLFGILNRKGSTLRGLQDE